MDGPPSGAHRIARRCGSSLPIRGTDSSCRSAFGSTGSGAVRYFRSCHGSVRRSRPCLLRSANHDACAPADLAVATQKTRTSEGALATGSRGHLWIGPSTRGQDSSAQTGASGQRSTVREIRQAVGKTPRCGARTGHGLSLPGWPCARVSRQTPPSEDTCCSNAPFAPCDHRLLD